jgi:hypothetical protein
MEVLLSKRPFIKMANIDNENPQHISAEFDNPEERKPFFFLKSRCFEKGSSKWQVRSFRFLKEIGANINIRNTKNDIDLHLTAETNCVNIVKIK